MEVVKRFEKWNHTTLETYNEQFRQAIPEATRNELFEERNPLHRYTLKWKNVVKLFAGNNSADKAIAFLAIYWADMLNETQMIDVIESFNPMSLAASNLFLYSWSCKDDTWQIYEMLDDAAKLYIESL